MSSGMSDQKFMKSFSIFLVLGVVLTLILILLGNLNAGTIGDQVRDERNALAESGNKNALQPVGQISVAGDEAAQAEILQESNKAKEELRAQVSALVIRGAEQVLEDNVDAGKHQEMLNKLAAEL